MNGYDEDDLALVRQKMTDHDRIIKMHEDLVHIKRRVDEMSNRVVYDDTCEAHRTAEDARHARTEADVKELKAGNQFGITTGLIVVSLILSAAAIIVAVAIHAGV